MSYSRSLHETAQDILASRLDDDSDEGMEAAEGGGEPGEDGENEQDEMSEAEFSAAVKSAIDDAVDYIDGFVAPSRAKAVQYYRGDPLGNEEEGRSRIVMTEVRDTVQAIVPSLLRIFTQSDQVVEFAPRTAQSVQLAEQATDYVNYVFYSDNPGFSVLHQAFKDALVAKTGVVKWRWSEDVEISEADYTGLDQGQVALLTQDENVEVLSVKEIALQPGMGDSMPPPPMPDGQGQAPQVMYDVRIKRRMPRNKVVVEAVPPEEFLIAREARDLDAAAYVGHRSLKTMSELVAMGYDKEEIEEYAGQGDVFSINYEAQTRNPAIMSFMMHADNPDPSMRRVLYVESYVRIDKDGDGIAELRKVCSLGNAHHILHDEVATDVPFAVFCPDPEPHMVVGQSIADQTMDLQEIKSAIVRNTMDSLAQVIHPRTVIIEGQVNIDDVLNNETGSIIRARTAGAVQPLTEPFVGQAAMPLIAYMDEIRAKRTGISPASQGLDPDVLQSTTKAAVTATVQGAQERIELIARLFAENGMKRLFRGLLKLLVRHQDKPRMIRLRQQWVEIDPRYWDADMDVIVNVGLGRGTDMDKMQFLAMVAQKQEQIIQMMGPVNPLANLAQYQNTLARICSLAGYKDGGTFFSPVDRQTMQQLSQPPKPDPQTMLVQVEAAKVQADMARDDQKLVLEREKAIMQDNRERERIHVDALVRLEDIKAKYGTAVDVAHIENVIAHDQAMAEAQINAATQRHATEVSAASQAMSANGQQ